MFRNGWMLLHGTRNAHEMSSEIEENEFDVSGKGLIPRSDPHGMESREGAIRGESSDEVYGKISVTRAG